MKKYLFMDVDEVTDEDIDVKGEDYAKLIDRLFKYGKIFTLQVPSNRCDFVDEIKQFAVTPKLNPDKTWTHEPDDGLHNVHTSYSDYTLKCFLCNDTTKNFLINKIGCIFEYLWKNDKFCNNVPMDLEVYREFPLGRGDNLLYYSTTHEGYAILKINDNEDFSDMLSEHWKQVDINFYPIWG